MVTGFESVETGNRIVTPLSYIVDAFLCFFVIPFALKQKFFKALNSSLLTLVVTGKQQRLNNILRNGSWLTFANGAAERLQPYNCSYNTIQQHIKTTTVRTKDWVTCGLNDRIPSRLSPQYPSQTKQYDGNATKGHRRRWYVGAASGVGGDVLSQRCCSYALNAVFACQTNTAPSW